MKKRRYKDPGRDRGLTCKMEKRSVVATVIEKQAEEIMLAFHIPDNWREIAVDKLNAKHEKPGYVQSQHKVLEDRLVRLKDLYAMGDIDRDEYISKRDEYRNQLDQLPLPVQSTVIDLQLATELLEDSQRLWEAATLRERKMWLQSMFERFYVYEGKIVAFQPTRVMSILLELEGNPTTLKLRSGQVAVLRRDVQLEDVQRMYRV